MADPETAPAEPPKRLAEWLRYAADGKQPTFEQRLRFDGLDVPAALRLLEGPAGEGEAPLPRWASCFLYGLSHALSAPTSSVRTTVTNAADTALAHGTGSMAIWALFVDAARDRLRSEAGELYGLLSPQAHGMLESGLVECLYEVSGQILDLEFEAFSLRRHSRLARLMDDAEVTTAALRSEFTDALAGRGLLALFREYPMLARLIGTALLSWVEGTQEFILRLDEDWKALRSTFGLADSEPFVASIACSISDRHHGGRTVLVVEFASGSRVVYKPRDLGIESAYNGFLEWLNSTALSLKLRTYRVLTRNTHGWAEFVESGASHSEAECQAYFQRCGMLLGVAHVLRATDLHVENIVAAGEHPVLVDLETLLHPEIRDELPVDCVLPPAAVEEWDSPLRTGLIPRFQPSDSDYTERAWRIAGATGVCHSAVTDPFADRDAERFWEQVIHGFCCVYRTLLEQKEFLLGPASPLKLFAGKKVRFVFRSTEVYMRLLRNSVRPERLHSGMSFSIPLETLARVGSLFAATPSFWPLVRVEQEALIQLDVPYFRTRTDSTALEAGPDLVIPDLLARSGVSEVEAKIRDLSEADLARQVGLVAGALLSRTIHRVGHTSSAPDDLPPDLPSGDIPAWLLKEAVLIGEDLLERKVSLHGRSTWITSHFDSQGHSAQLAPLRDNLYAGSYGIALFFATLHRVTGDHRFGDEARLALPELPPALVSQYGPEPEIGACVGIGSVIYALTRISGLLDMPELTERARQAAGLLSEESIRSDRRLDIYWGAAGAILGLLTLYEATGEARLLERAVRCGNHLLEQQVRGRGGGDGGWIGPDTQPLTGFAHGSAGISHALVRLYRHSGEAEFLAGGIL